MNKAANIPLDNYNTFGIPARARCFSRVHSLDNLMQIISENKPPKQKLWVLGGGSNILLTRDVDAWVLKNEFKGVKKVNEDKNFVWIEVGGGEDWHQFVMTSLANKWYGLENLALIPGTVGACPIQNIGAYGVEVKDLIHQVYAVKLDDGNELVYENKDCRFAYRNSIFKQELRGKTFIFKVIFKLKKSSEVNIAYRALKDELAKEKIANPTPVDIAKAVIAVRRSKLPDPAEIGNSGSFFKNPEISKKTFQILKEKFPEIPHYPGNDGKIKLAAGWLIDKAGWKGYRDGNIGVHEKQALVLVNYGGGTGKELFNLSEEIISDIQTKFGITLVREVNII